MGVASLCVRALQLVSAGAVVEELGLGGASVYPMPTMVTNR